MERKGNNKPFPDYVLKGEFMKSYWKQNGFIKRINNFGVYLFCAFASIFIPEAIDAILYNTLKKQFEEKDV